MVQTVRIVTKGTIVISLVYQGSKPMEWHQCGILECKTCEDALNNRIPLKPMSLAGHKKKIKYKEHFSCYKASAYTLQQSHKACRVRITNRLATAMAWDILQLTLTHSQI